MGEAFDRVCAAFQQHGLAVVQRGDAQASAQAPGHSPADRSVSLRSVDGMALMYSHADSLDDVLAGVGLTMRDLFDNGRDLRHEYPDGRIAWRSYTSTGKKSFTQRGNTKGSALYHADRIGDATTVYVVEGEKDVAAIESIGGVAVSPAMGAGKSHLFDWTPLHGKTVIIVADKDPVGHRHAEAIAETLNGNADVRIVEAALGKDAADHIAAGRTLDQLVPADDPIEGTPRLWRATHLRPAAQARWLAKGRLPRAAISLLVGDEGIGKSLLWVWIVAAITTGKPLPEFGIPGGDPAHVILVCTEDDWTSTVRPRLDVAGADLTQVQVICTEDDGSGAPTFPRDLFLIAEADPAPALVVVDAWLDTVPSMLSVRDPQQARQALHPWKEVATATDASVLLLCHTNRVASANARDRYGATGELRKKARMTLYAQSDDEGRLIVGPEKMNTAAPIPAAVFTITSVQHFAATADSDGTVPLLVYAGESDRTAREHIAASVDLGDDEPGGSPAKAFIYDHLMGQGGEANAADVLKAGRTNGFSDQELKDARRRHRKPRIVSRKSSFGDGWVWAIEGGSAPEGGTDTPEGGEGGRENDMPPSLPPSADDQGGSQGGITSDVPPSPPSPPSPPGGLKPTSPGQTDRVQQILAKQKHSRACPDCGTQVPAGHVRCQPCYRKRQSA